MSDKPFHKLNELDKLIRTTDPVGMTNGTITKLTITRIAGFELFNSRPYHNYETWSDGWNVEGSGIKVAHEDLDDAVKLWCKKFVEREEKP